MLTVEACHLQKRFGDKTAVDDISFGAEVGEVLGLVGPNGAGKTTLMLMLAGLLSADQGEVRLAGEPLRPSDPAQRRLIGWVPQQLAFYPGLSVAENLHFFGSLYQLDEARLSERVEEAIRVCRLEDVRDQPGSTLSGGTQRRLNLALGLVHEPSLLILDEPTVGIDAESRNLILSYLEELAGRGKTVILSSHYEEEIRRTCHRVLQLELGRLVGAEVLTRSALDASIRRYRKSPENPQKPASAGWRLGVVLGLIAVALVAAAGYFRGSSDPDFEPPGSFLPAPTVGVSRNSPDQTRLAYLNQDTIWIRELDSQEAFVLTGTEQATPGFFWSPDSLKLVFARRGSLWQTDLESRQTREICKLPEIPFRAGNWAPDGTILFSAGAGNVYRVPANGSQEPELLLRK